MSNLIKALAAKYFTPENIDLNFEDYETGNNNIPYKFISDLSLNHI